MSFHKFVQLKPSSYSAYLSSTVSNVNFQDGVGNLLYSWQQSHSVTNSSTAIDYYVLLPNAAITTIYAVLVATSHSSLSGAHTGAEPQNTSTWGQYDNGTTIFTNYGGKTWTNFTEYEGTWDSTNGYLEQTSSAATSTLGGPAALVNGSSYSVTGQYVLGFAFSYSGNAISRVGLMANTTVNSGDPQGYRFIGQTNSYTAGYISLLNDIKAWATQSSYAGAINTNYVMTITNNAGTWIGKLYAGLDESTTQVATLPSTAYSVSNTSSSTSGQIGISAAYYTSGAMYANPMKAYWFYLRSYPSGGTMPTATAGNVTVVAPPDLFFRYLA